MRNSFIALVLPPQESGMQTNTESITSCHDEAEAISKFGAIRQRLLDVNHWHELAGTVSAEFQLIDGQGNEVHRLVQKGDFFRIDIPGPGTKAGANADWVQVQHIGEEHAAGKDLVYFTVRSAPHPLALNQDIAHFFSSQATSTFIVCRDEREITAGVYGRNEKSNLKTSRVFDKIRNSLIAVGAMLGFSKLQWKALTHGLIQVVI